MKQCSVMQRLVTQLCNQHGVDLDDPEAYLKLKLPGDAIMPLTIERVGAHRLIIAHYYVCDEWSGELTADPDVEIFVSPVDGCWYPIAIDMPAPFGYHRYAELTEDGQRVAKWARQGQGDLACFCNQWARNLKEQGFLTRASVVAARPEPEPEPVPDPESVPAPEPEPVAACLTAPQQLGFWTTPQPGLWSAVTP